MFGVKEAKRQVVPSLPVTEDRPGILKKDSDAEDLFEEEFILDEISIDGMCGVY